QPVMRWLKVPRDVVRFFATGVDAGFVAANMIRDALSYPVFSSDGRFRPFGGLVGMIRGAIEYHRNGNARELYEELGVKTSSFYTEGERLALTGQQSPSKIQRGFTKLAQWADRAQEVFSHPEHYLRMNVVMETYNRAKAEGAPEVKARMLALEAGRERTVNFARAGILSRVLNQLIPYFNAGLQGKRKVWRQLLWGGDGRTDEQRA